MAATVLSRVYFINRQLSVLAILMLFLSVPLQAAGVVVEKADTHIQKGRYFLNADIRYDLSDDVLEALKNGIAITMQVTVQVAQQRAYLWNKVIAEQLPRYTLRFHALSGQYLVQSNKGEQRSYLSLSSALRTLGQIRELPLLEQSTIQDGDVVSVRIKSELDTDSLPAPLRPMAWLSSQWKLSSEWFTCPLQ